MESLGRKQLKKNEAFEYLKKGEIDRTIIENYLFESELAEPFDQSNKGKPWTDDELKVVLSFAPTKQNCLLLAKAFKRGYGSIEQIFRWATTDLKTINESERKDDSFVKQIKRIYKEMGWRA